VSPAGTAKDGPFQAFLGADGASIWAAATSGGFNFGIHAPIAVHLLACMLARAWEAKVATSIWAELVKERQKEIEDDSCTNATSALGLLAAQQEITREQLAPWANRKVIHQPTPTSTPIPTPPLRDPRLLHRSVPSPHSVC
jgi:hypothetical protein